MNWQKLIYPFIVGIVIVYLVYYTSNKFGLGKYKSEVKPITIDTVWSKIETLTLTKTFYKTKIVSKIDTVIINNGKVAVAVSDTVASFDSSKIAVRYYFPPVNKFDIYASIKEKTIYKERTVTIKEYEPESFWSRFGTSIQLGVGMGLIRKQADAYLGIGVHYKLN